jgi:hypothetical protein
VEIGGTGGLELEAMLLTDALAGMMTMRPVAAPGRRQRKFDGDQSEVLLTRGTLRDIANVQGGMAMLSRQVGVPKSTFEGPAVASRTELAPQTMDARRAFTPVAEDCSEEDLSMPWLKLDRNPETEEGIISATDVLPVLRTRWDKGGHHCSPLPLRSSPPL